MTAALRPAPTQALVDRYDAARACVDRAMAAGPADPALSARAAPLLVAEARLLDARAWDSWLALWDEEAWLWIPVHPGDHPGRDQALAFDDRRRLGERARHMRDPQAWATTSPAALTVRQLGPVEAWAEADGLLVACALTVTHVRVGAPLTLPGRQVLRLSPDARRVRGKALLFPTLALGAPAVGWLL